MTVEVQPRLLLSDSMSWPKTGTPKDNAANTPTAIVRSVIDAMVQSGHTVIGAAIEDQYLSVNPDSMKKLARNGGRWEEACRSLGIPVEWINTQTWQTKELGTCRIDSKEVKRRCNAKARGLWGTKVKDHEADASIIGRYHAIRKAFADLRRRRK